MFLLIGATICDNWLKLTVPLVTAAPAQWMTPSKQHVFAHVFFISYDICAGYSFNFSRFLFMHLEATTSSAVHPDSRKCSVTLSCRSAKSTVAGFLSQNIEEIVDLAFV
jgi:hypothetical protein